MRRGRGGWVGITLVAGVSVSTPALADSHGYSEAVCTVSFEVEPESEALRPVTECVHTEEGESSSVSSSGTYHLQIASRGCFYLGSTFTQWVRLEYTEDGELEYGWSPDGRPGGHTVIGTARPCSWTGVEREEFEGFVWSRIGNYAHQSPEVSLDPPIPRGLMGIETFAAMNVPSPWTFSSTSPYTGTSLMAEVKMRQVTIDWDDGLMQVFSGSDLSAFTGYPDGVASHTYQSKSCETASPRCRDETGPHQIETSYPWSGWYRVGSRRRSLSIPNTCSSTDYPVAEMIPLVRQANGGSDQIEGDGGTTSQTKGSVRGMAEATRRNPPPKGSGRRWTAAYRRRRPRPR